MWDGVEGLTDANVNRRVDIEEIDLGPDLDLTSVEPNPQIRVSGGAAPSTLVDLSFLTDHFNYAVHSVPLSPLSSIRRDFALSSPTKSVGVFDPTRVAAIAMVVDGSASPSLRVLVDDLEIVAGRNPVPDAGATLGLMGSALAGLAWLRRRSAKSRGRSSLTAGWTGKCR